MDKSIMDIFDYINGNEPSVLRTTLDDSKISHIVVFKALDARKENNVQKQTFDVADIIAVP